MMASPTVELCSSENSMSEEIAQELSAKGSAAKDKDVPTAAIDPSSDARTRGLQGKKTVSLKAGGAAPWGDESSEVGGQQVQSSSRKKRSRATPAEDAESNGRKSATDNGGRESSLWPGADGEGPVQGSLLEEVLAEKRMALMRSPEVLRFLQQRQAAVHAAQEQGMLQSHSHQTSDFSIGEVEEDAKR